MHPDQHESRAVRAIVLAAAALVGLSGSGTLGQASRGEAPGGQAPARPPATAAAGDDRFAIFPSKPNAVDFPPAMARYIRFVIHASANGQPCLDELEVYGRDGRRNLALAQGGAKATASSCLPGYSIHRIEHLNDGRYGNSFSWISASDADEWAQVELPQAAEVARIIFSRDRTAQYADRIPTAFEVRLSLDGRQWTAVRTVRAAAVPKPDSAVASSLDWPGMELAGEATWEAILRYAFAWEQETWRQVDPSDPLERVLRQMAEIADRLAAKGLDVARERAQVAELRRRQAALAASPGDPNAQREAFYQARLAKRRLFFRDGDLAALQKVLFVKRHPYEPSHNYSVILDARFRPGGGVYILEIPRRDGRLEPAEGKVVQLFDAGGGIARDPMADFDVRRVYFGYRPSEAGYYHLMVVNADGSGPRQLTDGPFHDYWPCPLPDGGLAFISTRCRARFICWRPQAFVLFRMGLDGGGLRPLSYANLSEWAPSVMADGRILWTRSEYLDKGADFGHTLWAIRPDGSHPDLVFGNNTIHGYANGREVPQTGEICCTLISHGGDLNGPIALIDPRRDRFDPRAVRSITPDVPAHTHMSWPRLKCFRDPVPVARDYFLCSHAPHDRFGLYVIDRYGNRELLYLDPAIGSMCPTPLRAISPPPAPSDARELRGDGGEQGQFVLADVYRGLPPTVKRGTVKYLRICQEVRADLERLHDGQYRKDHEPFQDYYATPVHKVSGPNGWPTYAAKGTFGLVPVEEDGSASFHAPAGKVLYFQVLDGQFNEVQRMRSVVQLQPGEKRGCIGCHEDRATAAALHRPIALGLAARTPEPPPWGAGPFSYERVVQPVWDARCIRCHDARHPRKIDLTGVLDGERVPASYRSLISLGLVHYFDCTWGREHHKAEAMTFGTVRSRLWQVLDAGHNGLKLSTEEMRRVKCWIDLNCPLWPDYMYRIDRPGPRTARAN